MFKRVGLTLALLAFVTVACEAEKPGTENETLATVPAAGATAAPATSAAEMPAAVTVPVQVDGAAKDFTAAYLAYFPRDVTVHPGDTVKFSLVNTGEPHTVTFGKDIDDMMALLQTKTPEQAADAPEVKKVPVLLPQGPGDAVQSAAQPCFLATGDPGTDACAKADRAQVDFNGTQTFYNSGWLTQDKTFEVKFSDSVKPGKYAYVCLLHMPDMSGTVTVVDKDTPIPSVADATKQGDTELQKLTDAIKPAIDQAQGGQAKPGEVLAGELAQNAMTAEGLMFIPRETTIKAGETVTWNIWGPHIISFNPPQDATDLRVVDPEGGVHLNQKLAMPAGGPGQPAPPPTEAAPAGASAAAPAASGPTPDPNGPPPPPTMIDAGEWDGTGYHSSGIILSFPPALFAYKLKFTKPGTYLYKCTIHPGMAGSVIVQ